jgi:hypothetical protein
MEVFGVMIVGCVLCKEANDRREKSNIPHYPCTSRAALYLIITCIEKYSQHLVLQRTNQQQDKITLSRSRLSSSREEEKHLKESAPRGCGSIYQELASK